MEALSKEHIEMIRLIQRLPELSAVVLWTSKQRAYLRHQSNGWRWIGSRIDYLQRVQLGFKPVDPASYISDPDLRLLLETHSNYYFGILQLLIQGFAVIQKAALDSNLDFTFSDPRQLFTEICRSYAQMDVEDAISMDVAGETLSQARDKQSRMGQLLRGSLSKDDQELLVHFKQSGWGCFWLAAILENVETRHLKKWHSWHQFQKSHRELRRFFNRKDIMLLKWCGGLPVWSANDSPIDLPS